MIFVVAIRLWKLLVLRNTLHIVSNETLLLRLPSILSCLAVNLGLPNQTLPIFQLLSYICGFRCT